MSLDSDWTDVLSVLRDEFGEGGKSRSMENSVIRTSLKGIQGRHKDQIIRLFYAFALVSYMWNLECAREQCAR